MEEYTASEMVWIIFDYIEYRRTMHLFSSYRREIVAQLGSFGLNFGLLLQKIDNCKSIRAV